MKISYKLQRWQEIKDCQSTTQNIVGVARMKYQDA